VVLDPGHGGRDPGLSLTGGAEKAQALDLALAVRRTLRRSGTKMTVILTREQDAAQGPDERAAAANAAEPAVFVSLHLSPGSESGVFILDPGESRSVAGTASGADDFLGFDAVSEQQHASWGSQQAAFAQPSGGLGRVLVRELTGRDTAEPDQAPLLLLRSVAAAAALVEVGAGQNRGQAAEAIARGIERYVREK
jgi:N-acetylmuramoyl-L-alanine amidase